MPTYDYQCESCGYQFEQFQPITAQPIKNCPKCCGATKRLIGAGGGIIFKGSGFYQTDYRSPSYRKKAEAEKKKSEPASAGQSSSKPDSTSSAPSASKKE